LALFSPHPAFDRVFTPGALSLGLVLPVVAPGETAPNHREQFDLARQADDLGFAALWVRDVPLNSADYPDPVEHLDPWVHLGALATTTRSIALVTGAIVSPLRHPLHVAKGALSVDRLSGGRMILGLGSGDRPAEFEAFGADVAEASERYRDRWREIEALVSGAGRVDPQGGEGSAAVLPRPVHGHIPMLAIGSSGQTIDWVARNANGWATYYRPLDKQRDRFAMWAGAVARARLPGAPTFAAAMSLDLLSDPQAQAEPFGLGLRLGRNALLDELDALRALGAGHVMFNLKRGDRPVGDMLEELSSDVLGRLA
jgi:luciferase-type oxidoreductase